MAVLGRQVTDRKAHARNLRIAHLCVQIGRQLSMSAEELRLLARAGLLHDFGKLSHPHESSHQRFALDVAGWQPGGSHPGLGMSMLERTGRSSRELRAVLYHHERLDGSGYPFGLSGEAIPIEARILAVADTYDALTSDTPYRRAGSAADARRVLLDEAGTGLDPKVVAALFASLDTKPEGVRRHKRRALAF
jgi:HD-GYP domain-containing protein (c-di-GMP phosphodiesterase class II)